MSLKTLMFTVAVVVAYVLLAQVDFTTTTQCFRMEFYRY